MKLLTATIAAREYMENYRDTQRFEAACRDCNNYGRLWTCPPLSQEMLARLAGYRDVLIAGARIEVASGTAVYDYRRIIAPVRNELETRILQLEKETGGLAFGFSGWCSLCPQCARPEGKDCRHPERVRPSLEAYGFDVMRTMTDLLGVTPQWGKEGMLPPHLTLVGALMHSSSELPEL